jgi:hypothetical protein
LRVGVSLSSIQELLKEAEALPVDLEIETKHIRAAVESATAWIAANTHVLSILQIPIVSVDLTLSAEIYAAISGDFHHDNQAISEEHISDHLSTENGVDEALKQHMADEMHIDVKADVHHVGDTVGYADVKLLMESASGLVVKFPELT